MTEKDLISGLNELKAIKPNLDWASWLLSNILSQSSAVSARQAKQSQSRVTLVSFSFVQKYQKALALAVFTVLFVSTFAYSQTTLPGSPLYPVKTLTQNAKIALASKDYKPVVRMQISKVRLEDISRINNQEETVALMSQNIQKDLRAIPQELKNIQKKEKALRISRQVQDESEDLQNIIARANLQPQDRETLDKVAKDTQDQVLSLVIETTEQINQCPSYLQDKLVNLKKYFTDNIDNLAQWPIEDITRIKILVADISGNIKAGNCLEALDQMESINQIMQIHSLGIEVETLVPTPAFDSGSGGSTPEN